MGAGLNGPKWLAVAHYSWPRFSAKISPRMVVRALLLRLARGVACSSPLQPSFLGQNFTVNGCVGFGLAAGEWGWRVGAGLSGPKWLAVAHYSWRPFGLVSRPKFHREWLCGLWSCGWPRFSAKISPRMVVRALVLRLESGRAGLAGYLVEIRPEVGAGYLVEVRPKWPTVDDKPAIVSRMRAWVWICAEWLCDWRGRTGCADFDWRCAGDVYVRAASVPSIT